MRDSSLADAVRSAFLRASFQLVPGPGADVLTLEIPDKLRDEGDEYTFTVVFSRDGVRLGDALESCPIKKLTECTDQLVLDTKTAAAQ